MEDARQEFIFNNPMSSCPPNNRMLRASFSNGSKKAKGHYKFGFLWSSCHNMPSLQGELDVERMKPGADWGVKNNLQSGQISSSLSKEAFPCSPPRVCFFSHQWLAYIATKGTHKSRNRYYFQIKNHLQVHSENPDIGSLLTTWWLNKTPHIK